MIRTQIQFTEDQIRALKAIAHREGISVAELVRRSVDDLLTHERSRQSRYERARRFIGVVDRPGAPTDLAAEHDGYLDAAFDASAPT